MIGIGANLACPSCKCDCGQNVDNHVTGNVAICKNCASVIVALPYTIQGKIKNKWEFSGYKYIAIEEPQNTATISSNTSPFSYIYNIPFGSDANKPDYLKITRDVQCDPINEEK